MFPALPTGMASTSGAFPNWSTTSNARLLAFDSIRIHGVYKRNRMLRRNLAHNFQRAVKIAFNRNDLRSVNHRLGELAQRNIVVRNDYDTIQSATSGIATAADVLPVEAHMMVRLPSSIAFATAMTMPRSLKEPVGFRPSNLKCKSIPSSSDRFTALMSGYSLP